MATPKWAIDDILSGYIDAALWSEVDESDEPLDSNYGPSDVSVESVRKMRADILKFVRVNRKACAAYVAHRVHGRSDGNAYHHLGHDLWLTRNGQGTGFWDRDYGGEGWIGEALTRGAEKLGESHLYHGDDGEIHVG